MITSNIRKSYLIGVHRFPSLKLLFFQGVLKVLELRASLEDPGALSFLFFLFYREVPWDQLVQENREGLVDLEVQCDLMKLK